MHKRCTVKSVAVVTVGLSVASIFAAVACASTEPVPDMIEAQETTEDKKPSTTIPETPDKKEEPEPDAGPPTKTCVSSCASDSQCANSCPTPMSGQSCCDVATNTCYTSATSTCPKPEPDAGPLPPTY